MHHEWRTKRYQPGMAFCAARWAIDLNSTRDTAHAGLARFASLTGTLRLFANIFCFVFGLSNMKPPAGIARGPNRYLLFSYAFTSTTTLPFTCPFNISLPRPGSSASVAV